MDDIHTRTASEVFGVPEDRVTPGQRRAAKVINFHALYGPTSGKTDLRAIRAVYKRTRWVPQTDIRGDLPGGVIRLLVPRLPE